MRPISNICPTDGTRPVPPASRRHLTTTMKPRAEVARGPLSASSPCILNPCTANIYRLSRHRDSQDAGREAGASLAHSSARICRAIVTPPFLLHVYPQPDQAEHGHAYDEIEKQAKINFCARMAPNRRQMRLQGIIIDSVAEKYRDEVLNPSPQACTQERPAHNSRHQPLGNSPTRAIDH